MGVQMGERGGKMRIPKFRAWVKLEKIMLPVGEIDFDYEFAYLEEKNGYRCERDFDEIELMQFTELKDKNGKEIYDGDIVIAWSQGVKGTFEIKRRIDGLWLLYPAWKDGQFWYLNPTEDGRETIEIIGNIYENHELLEGE